MPGVYVSNEKNVVDSVFLHQDFRYTHKVVVRDTLRIQKGRWEYPYGTIQLHGFKTFTRNLPVDCTIRSLDVNISFKGVIEIEINSDSDISYLKVK